MNNRKKRPKLSFGTVGWILVLGFLAYQIAPQVKAAFGIDTATTSVAPSLQLPSLQGETVSLESYRGQVVLVNFWATWCPPCRLEMPGFQRVYEDKRDDGFVVIALSTDRGDQQAVREFVEKRDLTFPVAMATGGVVNGFGSVRALPTSFLIDREGRIRQEVKGFFAEPTLRLAVNRLLEEEAPLAAAGAEAVHD